MLIKHCGKHSFLAFSSNAVSFFSLVFYALDIYFARTKVWPAFSSATQWNGQLDLRFHGFDYWRTAGSSLSSTSSTISSCTCKSMTWNSSVRSSIQINHGDFENVCGRSLMGLCHGYALRKNFDVKAGELMSGKERRRCSHLYIASYHGLSEQSFHIILDSGKRSK